MKTYAVTIETTLRGTGLVEAESEEEARQIAEDECGGFEYEPEDTEIIEVAALEEGIRRFER